jgi:hypothetical protein
LEVVIEDLPKEVQFESGVKPDPCDVVQCEMMSDDVKNEEA